MPVPSDRLGRLSEAQVCEIAGTSQQRRQTWVRRGWLRKAPAGGCSVTDALATAQLVRLITVLGSTDGPVAWVQVADELAQPFARQPLDVVFDVQLKRASLPADADALRAAVAHGRAVRVVALAGLRAEVVEAFRRLVAIAETRPTPGKSGRRAPGSAA